MTVDGQQHGQVGISAVLMAIAIETVKVSILLLLFGCVLVKNNQVNFFLLGYAKQL